MLSVVHTGVTLVSCDISSGFASSKRKVFVEQTVYTHVSNCYDTDVGSRFTEDRLGGFELLVYFIAAFSSSVIAVCRYAKLHITPRMF